MAETSCAERGSAPPLLGAAWSPFPSLTQGRTGGLGCWYDHPDRLPHFGLTHYPGAFPSGVLTPTPINCHAEVRRPTMDTFSELRQLADDLTELGDTATAALVRQAIDRFSAWKFEAGEQLLQERR